MSLKAVYGSLVEQDHIKVAAARQAAGLPPQVDMSQVDPGLMKQAQDYDKIGRILAHHVFADLCKQAIDEAGVPEEKKDAELERLLSQANGEKPAEKKDDKKPEDKSDAEGEKKEAAKKAILNRMAKDPVYVSKIVAKHQKKAG